MTARKAADQRRRTGTRPRTRSRRGPQEVELEDAAEQIMAGTEDAAGGNLPANDQAGEVQDETQGEGDGVEEVHD